MLLKFILTLVALLDGQPGVAIVATVAIFCLTLVAVLVVLFR
jgi:hypothetical protein